ncbi:MAG: aminotransferase class I/II-fold pyridoxal phosphate-dependent enzyme [Chloroflexota bacterium]
MAQTANRLSGIGQSVIREMTRLAIQHNAVNMGQGFPDFDSPPEMIAAAHAAIDGGFNQYAITWGIPELRETISRRMADWYALSYDPDVHISVTCGVTEAINSAVMALVNPGEEIVIIEPFHENYAATAAFAQAKAVYVPLEPPAYALDIDRIRAAFSDKTKAIILNSPHNPTGRVFTRTELQGLADLCQEFDVVVITDEIYDHIYYDDHEHIPIATLDGMYERTMTIGGMGKTFAVTGWRLGYVCAPEPYATAVRTVHDFTTICAPTPLQHAANAAFNLPASFYEQLRVDFHARRKRMMEILDRFDFVAQTPEGAYYVMSDFSNWDFTGTDLDFARYLTTDVGISVVPGSSFYNTAGYGESSVRWAFGKQLSTFDEVEARLEKVRS